MNVTVLLFARLKREAGFEQAQLDLPDGATVRDLAAHVEREHGVRLQGCMCAVNEQYANPDTRLKGGDEVAFLPPVAGGSADAPDRTLVTDAPLDLMEAQTHVLRPEWGAQAYFVGSVRSPNKGMVVDYLEYEAYGPMAEGVMRSAADLAREKHGILGVYVAHRTGRVVPGEVSIVIAVGSPHRRAALEACDFLIEHLKVHLPVWKLEVGVNGERWVEGNTGAPTL